MTRLYGLNGAPVDLLNDYTWDRAWASRKTRWLETWFRTMTGPEIELTSSTTGLYTVATQADADNLVGRQVDGRVLITGSNVRLRNFKVVGDGTGNACLEISGNLSGIEIHHFEVDGGGLLTPLAGLGGSSFANVTVHHGKIYNCLDRVRLFEGSTYQYMYLHDPVVNPNYIPGTSTQHADAVQVVRGGEPISLSRSWLTSVPPGGNVTSCVIVKSDAAAVSDVTVDSCYLNGGHYTVIVEEGAFGVPTDIAFTNNRFGRDYGDGVWSGAGVDPADVVRTGNIWADTQLPVTLTWGLL